MGNRPLSHLRAEFDYLAAQYDRSRKQLAALRERMPTLHGSAESPDKLVRVTVGPRGNLTKLEINPRAYRRLSASELAEAIMDTATKASRSMYAEMEGLLSPFLSMDAPLEKLMSGEADWSEHVRIHLPGSPDPRSVVDTRSSGGS